MSPVSEVPVKVSQVATVHSGDGWSGIFRCYTGLSQRFATVINRLYERRYVTDECRMYNALSSVFDLATCNELLFLRAKHPIVTMHMRLTRRTA